jgi:hypothetical protein
MENYPGVKFRAFPRTVVMSVIACLQQQPAKVDQCILGAARSESLSNMTPTETYLLTF